MAEFKISTNINRDADLELDYIVTKNANEVYNRIIHNYSRGQNSFTIIGSYGTGKSTFLWAFEHHLKGETKFDQPLNGEFKEIKKINFVRIVGDASSFRERFCEAFHLAYNPNISNKDILKEFDSIREIENTQKRVLVLLVDEFGKHLEYIAKENPEEMYFIQELAEYCNDKNKQVLFITTLHQNFSVYAKGLSKAEKSEWDKVRGRLIDIAFDEPVEQLLFFAAQRLKDIPVPTNLKKIYGKTVKTIA
ncbi:MAG: ATP-binding protein, partial [Flavobacteriaceae bacterium]|nr:ATP-binding protein [Flavobacteriaceae bacterium]